MSLLDKLSDEKVWIDFYERKVDPAFFRISDAKELFQYVRQKRYLPVVERIKSGNGLSIPMKKRIAKSGSSKKRVVYSLPEDETMVLKLLTWMMIRKYDVCLPENLYSFRPNYGAKDALRKLVSMPDISEYYSYKLDVRNYFNSIDVDLLLPQLKSLFIPINKTGRQAKNLPRQVDEAFKSENHILMFPAGICSRRTNGVIRDLEWKKTFITKSVQTQRDVVPIHFDGRNSDFFYNLANINKMLGLKFNIAMLYLADEMFKNRGQKFKVTIGKPIAWETFDKSKTPAEWAQYVQDVVYSLKRH